MPSEGRVRAIVRVVMDVEADSVWGTGTTWDQIAKQAEDGVRGMLPNGNKYITSEDIARKIRRLEVIEVQVRKESKK